MTKLENDHYGSLFHLNWAPSLKATWMLFRECLSLNRFNHPGILIWKTRNGLDSTGLDWDQNRGRSPKSAWAFPNSGSLWSLCHWPMLPSREGQLTGFFKVVQQKKKHQSDPAPKAGKCSVHFLRICFRFPPGSQNGRPPLVGSNWLAVREKARPFLKSGHDLLGGRQRLCTQDAVRNSQTKKNSQGKP